MGEVSPADAAAVVAAMGDEGELVPRRLARGCRCFAVWLERSVAGYGWLSTAPEWIGELGLEIRPGPGEAYVWNCVTLPDHRYRGFFRALMLHITRTAASEGFTRLWIGSVEGGAETVLLDAGFVPVVRFRALTVARLRWLTVALSDGLPPDTKAAALSVLGSNSQLRARIRRVRRHVH